jgi:hypothetical protein
MPLAYEQGIPRSVTTSGDDAFIGGRVADDTLHTFGSIKPSVALAMSGSTGDVRWSRSFTSFAFGPIALTATGDLAVGGVDVSSPFPFVANTIHVLILAHENGATLSEGVVPHPIDASCTNCSSSGSVTTLVPAPSGDLSVIGTFERSEVVVARLGAPDLHLVWRRDGGAFPAFPGHFLPRDATASLGGALVVAGVRFRPEGRFAVISFDATGAIRVCGDDTVDPGEACDDGNVDASDCCGADCSAAQPDGTACADDSLCTIDDRCAAGRCKGGGPLPCEPCGECHSASGCFVETPNDTCGKSTITNGSQIAIARPRRGSDRFAWSLRSGPATAKSDFGNPLESTGYALCASLPSGKLVLRGVAPAGACGRRRSCWQSTRAGFEYLNPAAPDGLAHLSLRAGGAGKAKWSAGGAHAVLQSLPLDEELYVELRRLDEPGICWSATLPKVTKNTARKFRAKGR